MAISIDWDAKLIYVPKSDTTLITAPPPQEIRQLDLDWFRLQLKALEAGADGMPFIRTHNHNPPVTVAGTVLARVVEIINGYEIEFEDGAYAVNLVGANSNVGDVTVVNQVSVRPQNSAGLQDLSSLQSASFVGYVTIDTGSGNSGTLFPTGTNEKPVDNLTDALAIAAERGIRRFRLVSDLTLDQDVTGFLFEGVGSHHETEVDVNGYEITNCLFYNTTVTGTGEGTFKAEDCRMTGLNFTALTATMKSCELADSVTMTASGTLICVDCYSSANTTEVIMGTSGTLHVRGHRGDLEIQNLTAGNVASVDILPGHLTLDSSCTGGTCVVKGVGYVTRNDAGAVTYDESGLVSDPSAKLRNQANFTIEQGLITEVQ
jgi:hypothetical protein